MNVLVLDDRADRLDRILDLLAAIGRRWSVTHTRTADGAIGFHRSRRFELVFLDHDLNAEEEGQAGSPHNSGMTVAHFIASNTYRSGQLVVVHSENGPRALVMHDALRIAGVACVLRPFGGLDTECVRELVAFAEALE